MREFWYLQSVSAQAPALILPGRVPVDYGALDRLAEDWEQRLLGMAAGGRPLVALEFATSVAAIGAYLGTLRAGLPLLMLEPGQSGANTVLLQRWQPEIRIAEEAGTLVALDNSPPAGGGAPADGISPHPDLRLLLPTSGSTGDPKLVRLSRQNIDANARSITEYLGLTPEDRAMVTLPLFYSYGLSVLNSYLAAGASLVLTTDSVINASFWQAFRAEGATSLALVPHQFDLLDRSGFAAMDLPKLRYVTQAGGRLAPDVARRFYATGVAAGWDLVIMYGQTEAAPRIAYVPPQAMPQAADTIGRAIPGGRLWLTDDSGAEITRPGIAGELVYQGPNVMMGYADTRADLARGAEVTALHTGDIAEMTPEGLFRIVGRLKRFVKLYGLRLSLDQIEVFLAGKGIAAQAVAVDDRLVILHANAAQGEQARDAIATEYDLPIQAIHVGHLAEVPRLASGKTDHQVLRRIATDMLTIEAEALPGDESLAEELMAATRSRLVGPGDSFASLGGDSLSYLQMEMALERRLGRIPEGWENMPLADLEALAPAGTASTKSTPVGIDILLRLAATTLVVAQHAGDHPLIGGVWMLIAVMGFTAARFQLRLITNGQAWRLGMRMLYPMLPLYFLLLALYAASGRSIPTSGLLFFGNYQLWEKSSLLTVYWFIGLYVQIVALLMLLALILPVRHLLARAPWGAAAAALPVLGLLALGLILSMQTVDGVHVVPLPLPHYPTHGFFECLLIFVLGWMLQRMKGRRQVMITLAMAIPVLALFAAVSDVDGPVVLLAVTVLLLAINPRLMLPAAWKRALQSLASVTMFVYLLHEIVVYMIEKLALPLTVTVLAAIPMSFIVAFAAKACFDFVDSWFLDLAARVNDWWTGCSQPRRTR